MANCERCGQQRVSVNNPVARIFLILVHFLTLYSSAAGLFLSTLFVNLQNVSIRTIMNLYNIPSLSMILKNNSTQALTLPWKPLKTTLNSAFQTQNSIIRQKASFSRMQRSYWSVICVSSGLTIPSCSSKQRLVHKTYSKMAPNEEDGENEKSKTPNLNRLIKARLEKLVGKTDATYVVPFLQPMSLVFNYDIKWTGFIRRIHAIALEENMALLLQGNQEAPMLRKHFCAAYFILSHFISLAT